MKDFRTWWRKGLDFQDEFEHGFPIFSDTYPYFGWVWGSDKDNDDCFLEQLWAIREGLAEEPEKS